MKKPAERSFLIGTHKNGVLSLTPLGALPSDAKRRKRPSKRFTPGWLADAAKENPRPSIKSGAVYLNRATNCGHGSKNTLKKPPNYERRILG